jgi:hypothetical protein
MGEVIPSPSHAALHSKEKKRIHSPNKITKPQHQNTHTSELHRIRQTTAKRFHQRRKRRRQRQRPKPLCKRHHARAHNTRKLPRRAPVERIVRRVRGLRDEDSAVSPLDEVVRADVCHDLGAWQDLRVELCLDLAEFLEAL